MFDTNANAAIGLYLECMLPTWRQMHLSNALSHLSSHNKATGKTIKNLDISIHIIEELTGFDSFSVEKLCHHTSIDSTLQLLIDHINNGFPDSSNRCPDSIKPYFSFRDKCL